MKMEWNSTPEFTREHGWSFVPVQNIQEVIGGGKGKSPFPILPFEDLPLFD